MSLYRCAACGSKNVVTDTETGGVKYNYVKGAVGTVVLGVGGAAAGIESKTHQVYKCAACGLSLTYAMPEGMKAAIDLGVEDAEARNHLSFNGVPVFWDYLTTKYPNIERGAADVIIEKKQQELATKEVSFSNLFSKMIAYVNTAVDFDIPTWDEAAQKEWESKFGVAKRNRDIEIDELIQRNMDARELLASETQGKIEAAKKKQDALKQSVADAESELASLGLFKMKEKKALAAKIEELKKALSECNPVQVETVEEKKQKELEAFFDGECCQKCLEVWKRYSIPASPKAQFEIHKFLEPIRIRADGEGITGNTKEKVEGLEKQIKQAMDVFEASHPCVVKYGSPRELTRNGTHDEKKTRMYDVRNYKKALILLLTLTAAKQPMQTNELERFYRSIGLNLGVGFTVYQDGDEYAVINFLHNQGSINQSFYLLKALGFAKNLSLVPFSSDELPSLPSIPGHPPFGGYPCKGRGDVFMVANV